MSENYITYDNVWATVHGGAFHDVKRLLTYRMKGYQHSRAFKNRTWDGYVCILRQNGRFPAGLVPLIVKKLGLEARHVDEFHRGEDGFFCRHELGNNVQPFIGHGDDAEVGVGGGEGIVSDLGPGMGQGVEYGRFADVGESDYPASKTHYKFPV